MRFWIGVENFAKIESARVRVDNYTLFVGPNNSGKTFLMQLVQGLSDKIVRLLEEDAMDILLADRIDGYSKYLLNAENIRQFIACINEKLHVKKEQLIKEIFGKEIPIEKLYIDVELEEGHSYQIDIMDRKSLENDEVKKSVYMDISDLPIWDSDKENKWKIGILSEWEGLSGKGRHLTLRISMDGSELYTFRRVFERIFEEDSLYLPASRTGLMLLYRDFFANRKDDDISFWIEDGELVDNRERYGGLTQPIYEFLRFLQTYVEDEEWRKEYGDELSFFEDKIIEGHITATKQGKFSYHAKDDDNVVPMHLASAMINEVAPLELALSSEKQYGRLIIDEAEASLHPQKQLELVRFLNRINNSGIKLILSTHSDTFVSKLNNLYILSELVKDRGDISIVDQFQLEEEDLIQPEKLSVYEFVFQDNGKSVVKEIIPDSRKGFQFDLFAKSAMDIYGEALRLGEYN